MITTRSSYREALEQAYLVHTHAISQLPPFSLPSNIQPHEIQISHLEGGSPDIRNYRAGFIGQKTAVLVHKLL